MTVTTERGTTVVLSPVARDVWLRAGDKAARMFPDLPEPTLKLSTWTDYPDGSDERLSVWAVPSSSRPGATHLLTSITRRAADGSGEHLYECSCPAGSHGHICWHMAWHVDFAQLWGHLRESR